MKKLLIKKWDTQVMRAKIVEKMIEKVLIRKYPLCLNRMEMVMEKRKKKR